MKPEPPLPNDTSLQQGPADQSRSSEMVSTAMRPNAVASTNPYAVPSLADSPAIDRSDLSLSAVIFWLAVICALIMLIVFLPGLGILATIVALPPLARTINVLARRSQNGASLTLGERLLVLGAACGGMFVALIAAAVTVFIVCGIGSVIAVNRTGPSQFGIFIWVIFAILMAVATAILILRALWKSK